MSASRSSSQQVQPKRKRADVDASVARSLAGARGSKTNTLEILKTLSNANLLKGIDIDDDNERSVKRLLTNAAAGHANTHTPYGPLLQRMDLGIPGLAHLEYINPFAYLFYLSTISVSFAMMMKASCDLGEPLRIIIYADSFEPGNPFRHDDGRNCMAIYWCIADWPQYILQRSFAWPVFSILQTKYLKKFAGGLSRLLRMVLRLFFKNKDASFTTGVYISSPSGDYIVTGFFAGFLADLVGHKEITDWKGHSGRRCCPSCDHITNMLWPPYRGLEVPANCSDPTKFGKRTNEDVHAIIDELARDWVNIIVGKNKGAFDDKETKLGFTFSPHGLLFDAEMRDVYKPVDHCIRDWQHTLCQDGVANTHIFNLITHMETSCEFGITDIQKFSQKCHYPASWGKLSKSSFDKARMKSDTIASFSSPILTMIIVLMLFLEVRVKDAILPAHTAAFKILFEIVGILRLGAVDAVRHSGALQTLIEQHIDACVQLYGDKVKPKAHHMLHIVEAMLWVGRLLSCFVTERKHRQLKQIAVHIYRHFEHTVLTDVLNQSIQQVLSGHDIYTEEFLICPKNTTLSAIAFRVARRYIGRVGEISAGDLVIDNRAHVGKVVGIYQRVSDGLVFLKVDAYPCIGGDVAWRATDRQYPDFFESTAIIDVLIWYYDSPSIVRFSVPPALLHRRDDA